MLPRVFGWMVGWTDISEGRGVVEAAVRLLSHVICGKGELARKVRLEGYEMYLTHPLN